VILQPKRILRLLLVLAAIAALTFGIAFLCLGSATDELRAEKALKVLQPRVQQYVDESGRLPTRLEDIHQPEILAALRNQVNHSGYDLLWIRSDADHGMLLAVARSRGDVRRAFVTPITVLRHQRE
jgi:hypothetical protein